MLTIKSLAFSNGQTIPFRFSKSGENISPPFEWSGVPAGAHELALVCDDPDAPNGAFTHWIIYGIDPRTTSVPEGLPAKPQLQRPLNARQGFNSAGKIGYIGPYPPLEDDWHHYRFRILALHDRLGLHPKVSEEEFYSAIEGNVLESAQIVGRYHSIKRLSEIPNYQLSPKRDRLKSSASAGVSIAARVSSSFLGVVPGKPLIALGIAALAGGVVAILRHRIRA